MKNRECASKTNYNHVDVEKLTKFLSLVRISLLLDFRDFDLGDELFERRKYKLLKHKLLKKKKKKKKILLKILIACALIYVAHILYFKFFPSVRRFANFKLNARKIV